ncbi:ABC transporter permease [Amycolatopsis vastitatis]|nr:ABC transporter permease [Amycolatopsis vastitatis]
MTSTAAVAGVPVPAEPDLVGKPAGFVRDLVSVSGRSLRQVLREPETLVPPMLIPLFFFTVFVGALEKVGNIGGTADFRAFQFPVAIVIASTGTTRATSLVNDINNGYFDRLLIAPTNRLSLLLGLMVADLVTVVMLCVPTVILGFILGVGFASGPLGVVVFIAIAALWGLAFAGLPYAIALRSGNATVVAQSSLLFFPFVFLTTTLMPLDRLSGWLSAAAHVNPVTYLLDALRSLLTDGWNAEKLLVGVGVVCAVAAVTFSIALLALRSRVSRS